MLKESNILCCMLTFKEGNELVFTADCVSSGFVDGTVDKCCLSGNSVLPGGWILPLFSNGLKGQSSAKSFTHHNASSPQNNVLHSKPFFFEECPWGSMRAKSTYIYCDCWKDLAICGYIQICRDVPCRPQAQSYVWLTGTLGKSVWVPVTLGFRVSWMLYGTLFLLSCGAASSWGRMSPCLTALQVWKHLVSRSYLCP